MERKKESCVLGTAGWALMVDGDLSLLVLEGVIVGGVGVGIEDAVEAGWEDGTLLISTERLPDVGRTESSIEIYSARVSETTEAEAASTEAGVLVVICCEVGDAVVSASKGESVMTSSSGFLVEAQVDRTAGLCVQDFAVIAHWACHGIDSKTCLQADVGATVMRVSTAGLLVGTSPASDSEYTGVSTSVVWVAVVILIGSLKTLFGTTLDSSDSATSSSSSSSCACFSSFR